MFKKFISITLVYLLATFQVAANANTKEQLTKALAKYDYMLTAHPQAHIDSFRKSAYKDLQSELESLKSELSQDDVKTVLDNIVAKIPSKKDQQEYRFMINTFSESKNLELLTDTSFIQKTFRGESSNFTTSVSRNVILVNALVIGIIVAIIIASDSANNDSEVFASSPFFFTEFGRDCWSANPFIGEYYLDEARVSCETHATNPETCRFGYVHSTDQGYNAEDDLFKRCVAQVYYLADKEVIVE